MVGSGTLRRCAASAETREPAPSTEGEGDATQPPERGSELGPNVSEMSHVTELRKPSEERTNRLVV